MIGKSLTAEGCGGEVGAGFSAIEGFGGGDVADRFEFAQVDTEVAVCRVCCGAQSREIHLRIIRQSRQSRHDLQTYRLMDDRVKLGHDLPPAAVQIHTGKKEGTAAEKGDDTVDIAGDQHKAEDNDDGDSDPGSDVDDDDGDGERYRDQAQKPSSRGDVGIEATAGIIARNNG